VFSKALHPGLHAAALEGSFASVIGGSAAAKVVFGREVRARAAADPRLAGLFGEARERALRELELEKQAELADEFDAVHSVARAQRVGSLDAIVAPSRMRPFLIDALRNASEPLSRFRE
jgi:acetyl-CoA carboxylase carboxyltransferase component